MLLSLTPHSSPPGIGVSNTPGAVDEATATTTLYLIISTLRLFSKAERSLRAGTWKTPISSGDTHALTTRTLGILGLGGIGLHLAHLIHAFPMRVLYHNRRRRTDVPEWCEYVESLEELCKQVDVLSVHVPLCEETKGMVGDREIRAMKRGSVLVNTARGGVVDEEAMILALEDGHVRVTCRFVHTTMLTVMTAVIFSSRSVDLTIVGVGRSGRIPRRTAGQPAVARVPAKCAASTRQGFHAQLRTKVGRARDDELEGFLADRVRQGPRPRVEMKSRTPKS